MERNTLTVDNNEIDDDDIEPSELIDTQENKPKITHDEDNTLAVETKAERRKIALKQVSKLTDDEKTYLVDLYRKGGEDEFYKVYFYKNGTHKIVKRKQPPKYNTAKRILEAQKPTMTNEQILMEHVIDLETKFATLYQKHKKLKKNYKSLQEDIYYDDNTETDAKEIINEETKPEITNVVEPEPIAEPITSSESTYNVKQTPQYNEFQNNYINRIKRPQKGYRKIMAQNL